jgi:hypothetical protein
MFELIEYKKLATQLALKAVEHTVVAGGNAFAS